MSKLRPRQTTRTTPTEMTALTKTTRGTLELWEVVAGASQILL